MAADWLLYMQNDDGGYSRKFSLINGRDRSYIETTGYIVPTLLAAAERLDASKYRRSALRAGEWLLRVQNGDGSFSEIDGGSPFAFDTGQCLIGLNALFRETGEARYLQAAEAAARWLVRNQEEDGSWQRVAYNFEKHSYYTRVAAAMAEYGALSGDEEVLAAARKHIRWALSRQRENAFFDDATFLRGHPPYLHTLVYVLEGLLDYADTVGDESARNAAVENGRRLMRRNLERELLLCSQYDENFECVNAERCITGLAQWAGVALRLHETTGEAGFRQCAVTTLFYLKAKQVKRSLMQGGFTASVPFWGRYGSFEFVNWNNKFFIDALLHYERLGLTPLQEQESFVSHAFMLGSSVVTEELGPMDLRYIEALRPLLRGGKRMRILDVGCGKGAVIRALRREFPDHLFFGIDPVFEGEGVRKGSAYRIGFDDESFDLVISLEVLQHTRIESALRELHRVLKPGGTLAIGERNPRSVLGVLKPWLEWKGGWMYPFDTPFREKWYGRKRWLWHLKKAGFFSVETETIEGEGKPFVNRYFWITGEKQ